MPDVLTLPIRASSAHTPLTRLVRLDLGTIPFAFRAGQAVMVGQHGRTDRRPYSIASSPDEAMRHHRLDLLVKVDAAGQAGRHLPDLLPGMRVDLEGPFGSFTLPDRAAPGYLFVAGGTGIAPIRSMVRQLIATGVRVPISVLYSARTTMGLAYAPELERLARRGLISLSLTVTGEAGDHWTGIRGRIDGPLLTRMLPGPDTLCFVCGPPAMVEDLPLLLVRAGISSTHIRVEEY